MKEHELRKRIKRERKTQLTVITLYFSGNTNMSIQNSKKSTTRVVGPPKNRVS